MLPLSITALDPEEAWGSKLQVRCTCKAEHPLWAKRCPKCKSKNGFHRLRAKRARVERWLDRRIADEIMPALAKGDLVPGGLEQFRRMLDEVARRPIPERMKKEDLGRYLKRVVTFFPQMFKTTSPARLVRDLDDRMRRSARAIARAAVDGSALVAGQALGRGPQALPPGSVEAQAAQLQTELARSLKPLLEALKTLKMYHDRMVLGWAPVRALLSRPVPEGKVKAAWNKVRSMVSPVGQLMRFGTAIWQDPAEREHLQRFEAEILRFLEQVGRFQEQAKVLDAQTAKLHQTWRLSLRKHLLARLSQSMAGAAQADRRAMADTLLAQRGVGGFWWRLFFAGRARRPG